MLDKNLFFAGDVAAFAAAGTNLIGTAKSLGGSQLRANNRNPLKVVIQVTEAFAGAGTVDFILSSDDTATVATDGSASDVASSGAMTVAELTLGKNLVFGINNVRAIEEFVGILVTGTGTTTAGKINAFLALDTTEYESFPDAAN